jgi:hypothetical protein
MFKGKKEQANEKKLMNLIEYESNLVINNPPDNKFRFHMKKV